MQTQAEDRIKARRASPSPIRRTNKCVRWKLSAIADIVTRVSLVTAVWRWKRASGAPKIGNAESASRPGRRGAQGLDTAGVSHAARRQRA